jgi:hypothetical protein
VLERAVLPSGVSVGVGVGVGNGINEMEKIGGLG